MKYQQLNQQIIELVGGEENIKSVAHCMTRLRLTLNDRSKAKTDEIAKLDGVIDVVSNDIAYQIIIGTNVSEVYAELMDMLGTSVSTKDLPKEKQGIKGIATGVLSFISETMTSILPALIATGILSGVVSILVLIGALSEDSSTFMILDTLRSVLFVFLPVFIGASAANRLKVNQYVAMILALTLVAPSISGVEGLSIFGIPLQAISYTYTFIPILLGVWFLSLATKLFTKIIPKSLHYFLVPMLSLLLTLPIVLLVFGPIGNVIGNGLDWFFDMLGNTIGNWIVVMIYAAIQPLLIVFGAANFTYPITLNFFATLGIDPIFSPAATISDLGVCGAMIGYFLRAKRKEKKQTFGTVAFSALMGTTEPAVFGVFVKYRRPFLAVMIGGGIGGLIAGLTSVHATSMVWGLTSLPTYLAGGLWNFIWMVIACATSLIISGIVAYGIGIPSKETETLEEEAKAEENMLESQSHSEIKNEVLTQIAEGETIALNEVSDAAFSSGALGKGIAIIPSETIESIYSPINGTIVALFPTKHAYGLKTESGIEVLIHIGVDTVNLDGQYFETFVEQGQKVKKGEKLGSYDVEKVSEAGFDPTIMVVITNAADFMDVIPNREEGNLLTVIF